MTVNDEVTRLTRPANDRDHSQGSPDAVVTLVEYGDYECPYCGRAYLDSWDADTLEQALRDAIHLRWKPSKGMTDANWYR